MQRGPTLGHLPWPPTLPNAAMQRLFCARGADRLRLAVQAADVGLWDWDIRTNQVVYSNEWKRQLGYAEHEVGNGFGEWERLTHPDDLAQTQQRMRESLSAADGTLETEFRMRHKDGSWRWIYTRGEVSRDGEGKTRANARLSSRHDGATAGGGAPAHGGSALPWLVRKLSHLLMGRGPFRGQAAR